MLPLITAGAVPKIILENSRPADWAASLALVGDTSGLISVTAIGPDALDFSVNLNLAAGIVSIAPAAAVDYETFSILGRLPQITLHLQFNYANGTSLVDKTSHVITVLNQDDTPPAGLAFATGGSVEAGALGATIGTLAVTDGESAGPFQFSVAADDAWRFDVVGNMLELKPGVSLGLDDMPTLPVIITVSEGTHAAAFVLDIVVTPEAAPPPPALPDIAAAPVAGFVEVSPTLVVAVQPASSIATATPDGAGHIAVTTASGTSFTVAQTAAIQLPSGVLDFNPQGMPAQIASLMQAAGGAPASNAAVANLMQQAAAGTSLTDLAGTQLSLATLAVSDNAYVAGLFMNSLGRAPTTVELALDTGRLAGGESRAQLAVDIALGHDALAHQATISPAHWVPMPLGDGSGAGSGGLPAAAAPPPDQIWLS